MAEADPPPPYSEKPAPAISAKKQELRYVGVDASQHCAYLLRSDGIIDRTSSGRITRQVLPGPDHEFSAGSAGNYASYFLRSDGVVFRSTNGTYQESEDRRNPPPGVTYTAISAGYHASYFVRSDGAVDRATKGGHISSEIKPAGWPAVSYVKASSGYHATFFLRNDGIVDEVHQGKVKKELQPANPSHKFVDIADQTVVQTDKTIRGVEYMYLITDHGAAERLKIFSGSKESMPQPQAVVKTAGGVKYTAATAGPDGSYLVRDDGAVDRIYSGKTTHEMRPSNPAAKYIGVSTGGHHVYFLRDDGIIDRSSRAGKISDELTPRPEGDIDGSLCRLS